MGIWRILGIIDGGTSPQPLLVFIVEDPGNGGVGVEMARVVRVEIVRIDNFILIF